MAEKTETLVPLVYLALTLMAYYGPNAEILGNIKLRIWHYQTIIVNIEDFVSNLMSLFVLDSLSFVINGILLWKYCQTNVLKVLKQLQSTHWIYMSVVEAVLLMEVNIKNYWKLKKSQFQF